MFEYKVSWTEFDTKQKKTVEKDTIVRNVNSSAEAAWQVANEHVIYPTEAKLISIELFA